MENYGPNESKDSTSSSTEKGSDAAKPAAVKAQSLAELLIQQDIKQEHQRTIWQRETESKKDDDEDDKPGTTAATAFRLPRPTAEPKTSEAPESTAEPAANSEVQADPESAEDLQLSELEPDEARAITEQYANGRNTELHAEQAEQAPGTPEQAVAEANAAMMQKLADKLRAVPQVDPEQAVNEAADEVIAERHLQPAEHSAAENANDPENPVAPLTPLPPRPATASNMPNTPQPPGPPPYPFMPGFSGGPGGVNPNLATAPSAATSEWGSANITPIEAQYYARQAENRGLLLGGIVGYLVGRRRGRIKTEKRLLPVQKKLEQNVTNLHNAIAGREQQIRTLAAEKARSQQAQVAERQPAKQASRPEAPLPISRPPEAVVPAVRAEASMASTPQRYETVPIPTPQQATEAAPTAARQPEGSAEQRVERMNQQELLKTAETVVIEGASLRKIYEAHRITERGLRHIITEHLRGGDIKKALDQELAIKELTYERDPQLRDNIAADTASSAKGGALSQSNADDHQSHSPLDAVKSKVQDAASQLSQQASKLDRTDTHAKQVFIRAWVVLVIMLVIMVVILLFR